MLTNNHIWGAIPPGFTKVVDPSGNRLILRPELEKVISVSLCRDGAGRDEASPFYGRGALRVVRLQSGETAVIRAYRHGGVFRCITGEVFVTWPPRPFRELSITEELRRRGIPTVEVYGACVERICGPLYRGWLVTRELREAQDLWLALQNGFVGRMGPKNVLAAVANSLRALHREGVYHGDLNLKNILVRKESDGIKGYIIDFDKAKLLLGPVPPILVRQNLERLRRSVRKLDPQQRYFSSDYWDEFVKIYLGADRGKH